jgi:hypothetical protein
MFLFAVVLLYTSELGVFTPLDHPTLPPATSHSTHSSANDT